MKPLKLAFANFTTQSPGIKELSDNFGPAVKVTGDSLSLYDNNGDATTAVQNAKLMVEEHPDVILEWAPGGDVTDALGKVFKASGIPCVAIVETIPGCASFILDEAKLGEMAGTELAKVMESKGWDGTNTTYVIGQYSKASADVNGVVRNAFVTVAHTLPGFPSVKLEDITATTTKMSDSAIQLDSGTNVDSAFAAMNNLLQTIPQGRNIVFYGITAEATEGGNRALSRSGRTNYMVAGNGGGSVAVTNLRSDDHWVVQSATYTGQWAPYLITMAHAIVQGANVPDTTLAPVGVITKDTVDDIFAAGSSTVKVLPPLPDESKYLLDFGILQKFGPMGGQG